MERNKLGAKSSVLQMKARSDSNVQKKWFCHRTANALLVTLCSQNQKRCWWGWAGGQVWWKHFRLVCSSHFPIVGRDLAMWGELLLQLPTLAFSWQTLLYCYINKWYPKKIDFLIFSFILDELGMPAAPPVGECSSTSAKHLQWFIHFDIWQLRFSATSES